MTKEQDAKSVSDAYMVWFKGAGATRENTWAAWSAAVDWARSSAEPRTSHIKTWRERCDEIHDDMVIVSSRMVQQRMQEEIDDLRAALNRE